ncbi:MAG: hypothetical protein HYV07_03995 [Deltaproteobacteria bacterium]|nr:hypothetical protein [Deltaproteobacteria bacterium]
MSAPFVDRTNDRALPPDYDGDLVLFDIDKTYLDTRFSSIRGLAAIPFDAALDKRAIPGSVPLLRALRRGIGATSALVPIYFVSGSPKQLRGVIERKMTLDGVEHDGITFKDQLGLVRAGRIRDVKRQLGYKLLALLLYRAETPEGARWLLFGDDVEEDAAVFTLFGEVCAGFRGARLEKRLKERQVASDQLGRILELTESMAVTQDPVERVFIHLERGSDPGALPGARTLGTKSFLQTALLLRTFGRIRPESVAAVAQDLRKNHLPESKIEADLVDAKSRLGIQPEVIELARRGSS